MSECAQEPVGTPITLANMLQRRDARVDTQRALITRLQRPLVQLTLVNPGPVKDTALARFVFSQGLAAMTKALSDAGHSVLAFEQVSLSTGPEALCAVDAAARDVKRIAMVLEDQHPLGRLWDLDVMGLDGTSLSRQQLDAPARLCLICEKAAHACARGRSHTLAHLQHAIKELVDAYRLGVAD